MKLTEALELLKDPEALRIRAAELDGFVNFEKVSRPSFFMPRHLDWITPCSGYDLIGIVRVTGGWMKRAIPAYESKSGSAELAEAERRLGLHDRSNTRLRVQWVNYLHDILAAQPDCPVNKVGNPLVSDIDKLLAPVEVRCLAFVMAAEWKKSQSNTTT